MKLTDLLVSKCGSDKLLHFTIAGWLCSISADISSTMLIIVDILLIILSICKELFWDTRAEWGDFIADIIGIIISNLVYFLL